MRFSKKMRDLILVVALVFFAAAIAMMLQLNFLYTSLLFFGLPSAYLLYRKPDNIKKVSLAALLFGIIWGFSFDYIAELNNAWYWASNTDLVIPLTLFGVVSADIMVWYFFWIFNIICFYEYFIEYDRSRKIAKNAFAISVTGIIIAFLVVSVSKVSDLLLFSHTYLWLGTAALVPYVYIVIKRPVIFPKTLLVVPYFFLLYFVFEITALHMDLWSFPGQYIGYVSFGSLVFPFEELFFWNLASSAVAVAYYEHSIDDLK